MVGALQLQRPAGAAATARLREGTGEHRRRDGGDDLNLRGGGGGQTALELSDGGYVSPQKCAGP